MNAYAAQATRPTWDVVARADLSNQLKNESLNFITEANLWHDEPEHNVVARAASQLAFMAQLVIADCAPEVVAEAEAWLRAGRTMLPRIQSTRERRSLGTSIYTTEPSA